MASTSSLTGTYQIPALDGRMREAQPVKFALKFREKGGPSIGVVYTFQPQSKKNASKKSKKYIHEIKVDLPGCREKVTGISKDNKPTLQDVEKLAETLCENEPTYLNVNIISRTQVSTRRAKDIVSVQPVCRLVN